MIIQLMSILRDILVITGVIYLIFFKSYFREKGKNLATLEDIEGITLKVEGVKKTFKENIENLRADLAKQNISHQLVYAQLLEYRYKRFDSFFDALIDIQSFIKENLFSYKDEQDYLTKKDEFFRLYKIVDLSRFKINMYISDTFKQKLIDNLDGCYEAFTSFVKMYNSDTKKFGEFDLFSVSAQKVKLKMIEENIDALNKLNETVKLFPKLLTELEDEAKKAIFLKDNEYGINV